MNREELDKLLRMAQAAHYEIITTEIENPDVDTDADSAIAERKVSNVISTQIVLLLIVLERQFTIDLYETKQVVMGRSTVHTTQYDGLDFAPFGGYEYGLSRQHAMLTLKHGNIILRDLGSLNGTFINGVRLQPEENYVLRHGDTIRLGLLEVRVSSLDD